MFNWNFFFSVVICGNRVKVWCEMYSLTSDVRILCGIFLFVVIFSRAIFKFCNFSLHRRNCVICFRSLYCAATVVFFYCSVFMLYIIHVVLCVSSVFMSMICVHSLVIISQRRVKDLTFEMAYSWIRCVGFYIYIYKIMNLPNNVITMVIFCPHLLKIKQKLPNCWQFRLGM